MKKILIIFGTRPEAIKLAPIIMALKNESQFRTRVCITAQHRSMLDSVLELFEIRPDYDLNIMRESQDLFDISSKILANLKDILYECKPDLIIVHGDTTTTFIATLAAFYCKIPVAHIEAGLRTGDRFNPFPEEMNRILTTKLATYHFAPTTLAHKNLLRDGVAKKYIKIVGNTVIDALKITLKKIRDSKELEKNILRNLNLDFALECDFILVTAHRRESFGKDIENIALSLKAIAQSLPQVQILYPLHLNPHIQKPMREILGDEPRMHLVAPLDYVSFVYVMSKCYCILTDSGGIQEEATFLHKPTLILRNTTERKEVLKCHTLKLVGTEQKNIINETLKLFSCKKHYLRMANPKNSMPYGRGNAAKRIIKHMKKI